MRRQACKILCIEDDHETATLIMEELVHRGFDVHVASNGVEGFLTILKLQPDLVLSDIIMPNASGLDVLSWLNAMIPRILNMPFIFLTALADLEVERKARRLGADDFITKPVDFDVLEAVIRASLASVSREAGSATHRREQLRSGLVELRGGSQNI